MKQYTLWMKSEEFGADSFTYDSLEELIAGFGRLVRKVLELDDGVLRKFEVEVGE